MIYNQQEEMKNEKIKPEELNNFIHYFETMT